MNEDNVQDNGAVDAENPWPGLPSFREIDTEFFHGRKLEIEELGRMVSRERVTVLFGASGLGKTSLLQAGLFPLLRRERLLPVLVRLKFSEQGPLAAQVQRALAHAAEAALLDMPPPQPGESLWELLHDRTRVIKNRTDQVVTPLVVLDQFEEFFTVGANHPDRAAFIDELASLVEGYAPACVTKTVEERPERAAELDFQSTSYKLILTLREDFIAEMDCLRRVIPSVMQNRYRLRAFDPAHAREVVALPGVRLVAPDAVGEIVEFVARRPRQTRRAAEGSVDPSILSVVCRELNNQRRTLKMPLVTKDLLQDMGDEILVSFYARALQRVPADAREVARRFIEDRLVTASGFRGGELQSYAETTIGQDNLKALVDSRVLRLVDRESEVWVELTHDVLVPVVIAGRDERKAREAKLQAEEKHRTLEQQLSESSRRQRWAIAAVGVMTGLLATAGWLVANLHQQKKIQSNLLTQIRDRELALDTLLTDSSLGRDRNISDATLMPQLAYLVRSRPTNKVAGTLLTSLLAYGNLPLPLTSCKPQTAGFTSVNCSSGGEVCATGSEDGSVDVWEPRTCKKTHVAKLEPDYTWVEISRDGAHLLISTERGHLELIDMRTLTRVGEAHDERNGVSLTALSDRGDYVIFSQATSGYVALWRPAEHAIQYFKPESQLVPFTMNHANGYVAVGVPEGRVSLWKIERSDAPQQPVWTHGAPGADTSDRVTTVDVSRDGHVVGVFAPRSLGVWDKFGKLLLDIVEPASIVDACLTPDGQWLSWATADHVVRVRALSGNAAIRIFSQEESLKSLATSRDSRTLIAQTVSGPAVLWDLKTGNSLGRIPRNVLNNYSFAGPGSIFSASFDGHLELWDTRPSAALPEARVEPRSCAVRARFVADDTVAGVWREKGDNNAPVAVRRWRRGVPEDGSRFPGFQSRIDPAISGDGNKLVTIGMSASDWTYTPSLHTLGGSDQEKTLPAHHEWINTVAFSPDGAYFAAAFRNGQIRLWDTTNPTEFRDFTNGNRANDVSLSDGGRRIASTSNEKAPRVFDSASKQEIGGLSGHEVVSAVSLSANGSLLATVADNTVRVWSLENEHAALVTSLHDDTSVSAASFSPSNEWIATVRGDNTVRLLGHQDGAFARAATRAISRGIGRIHQPRRTTRRNPVRPTVWYASGMS